MEDGEERSYASETGAGGVGEICFFAVEAQPEISMSAATIYSVFFIG